MNALVARLNEQDARLSANATQLNEKDTRLSTHEARHREAHVRNREAQSLLRAEIAQLRQSRAAEEPAAVAPRGVVRRTYSRVESALRDAAIPSVGGPDEQPEIFTGVTLPMPGDLEAGDIDE